MELAQTHCQGRLVFILEGGYDLAALAHGVRNTMRGVLGLPADDPLGPAPDLEPSIAGVLEKVKTVHGL